MGRATSVLALGTLVGQGAAVLASPLLTRLFSPEDFGVFGVFVALASVGGVAASLRYSLAIPLPEDDADASDLLIVSLFSVAAVSGLACIATWGLASWLHPALGMEETWHLIWLLPVAVAVIGVYDSLTFWAIRLKSFGLIARTRIAQGIGLVLGQTCLGGIGLGAPGLVIGHIFGRAVGLGSLARLAVTTAQFRTGHGTIRRLFAAAIRHRRFPLYSTWSALANTISTQVPNVLLAYYFGLEFAGLLALSARVLQTPLSIVGTAVAQVFLADAAGSARNARLAQDVGNAFRDLTRLALPLGTVVMFVAPAAFEIVFGSAWRPAGRISQLLVPWLALVFVASPLSTVPSVLGKQRGELIFNLALLGCRLAALSIGGATGDPFKAIAAFAAVSTLGWLWFLAWTLKVANVSARTVAAILGQELRQAISYTFPTAAVFLFSRGTEREALLLLTGILTAVFVAGRAWHQSRPGRT